MSDVHRGGCYCGAVRYETIGAPERTSACACRWCQLRTGSAIGISVYFKRTNVTILQGDLQPFRLTSDAGRMIETEFCRICGTTVTWTLDFLPEFRGIAGGTFDQPTFWYDLERFVFARSKPDWFEIPTGLDVCQAMAE